MVKVNEDYAQATAQKFTKAFEKGKVTTAVNVIVNDYRNSTSTGHGYKYNPYILDQVEELAKEASNNDFLKGLFVKVKNKLDNNFDEEIVLRAHDGAKYINEELVEFTKGMLKELSDSQENVREVASAYDMDAEVDWDLERILESEGFEDVESEDLSSVSGMHARM